MSKNKIHTGNACSEELVLAIRDLAENAHGVGIVSNTAQGQHPVVFVPGALPGERWSCQGYERKGKIFLARQPQLLEASPARQNAFCPHFALCGGCQIQHFNYEASLSWKRKRVVDLLSRLGQSPEAEALCASCLGLSEPYQFRNKVQLQLSVSAQHQSQGQSQNQNQNQSQRQGQGEYESAGDGEGAEAFALGFFQEASHSIVEQQSCPIQPELFLRLKTGIAAYIRHGLSSAQLKAEQLEQLLPERIVLRCNSALSQGLIVLQSNSNALPQEFWRKLLDFLAPSCPEVELGLFLSALPLGVATQSSSVTKLGKTSPESRVRTAAPASTASTASTASPQGNRQNLLPLAGLSQLREQAANLQFELSPLAFFQTNLRQNEVLFATVRQLLVATAPKRILDLYCGVGSLSLIAAQALPEAEVWGVESFAPAVLDAKANAQLNQLANAEFFATAAEAFLLDPSLRAFAPDLILVDPPRQGLAASVVQNLLELKVGHIIYVSCDPASLARDVSLLRSHYDLTSVQPLDMFPWSSNVETVALLSRVEA